jgi:hypothetical protein
MGDNQKPGDNISRALYGKPSETNYGMGINTTGFVLQLTGAFHDAKVDVEAP